MRKKATGSDRIFNIVIMILTGVNALIIILPLMNVLANSFSSVDDVVSGNVGLFPVNFTLDGYKNIFGQTAVWNGFKNSVIYTLLGTILSVTFQVLCAYPLSRPDFKFKKALNLFLVITMFISGGMIPTYLIITQFHLYNTIWAIILPGCISVFNIIVIRTYMQTAISKEVQEAAMIDGCGDFQIFFKVVLPLCRPIIAVMILYAVVSYWNSYFNALMYIQDTSLYPLQNVLSGILTAHSSTQLGGSDANLSEQLKYVTIVISSVPLLIIYPFFQKYFEKGVTIGGLKG